MTPPSAPQLPDDRPTTEFPSLASLAQPAPDTPPPARTESPAPYWPATGGPTVYRPESAYRSVTAPPPPRPPVRPVNDPAPHRRWPWVVGGAVALLAIIGIVNGGPTSSTPITTISVPETPAPPGATETHPGPATVSVPAPPVPAQAPIVAPVPAVVMVPAAPHSLPAPSVAPAPPLLPTPGATPIPTAASLSSRAPATTPPTVPAQLPEVPVPAPPADGTQVGSTGNSTGGSSPYYPNCAAARAAGVTPLHRGVPGYRSGLDRDGDGVACE
jgi:hypothetical protein